MIITITKMLNNIRTLANQGEGRIFKDWNLQVLYCAVLLGRSRREDVTEVSSSRECLYANRCLNSLISELFFRISCPLWQKFLFNKNRRRQLIFFARTIPTCFDGKKLISISLFNFSVYFFNCLSISF